MRQLTDGSCATCSRWKVLQLGTQHLTKPLKARAVAVRTSRNDSVLAYLPYSKAREGLIAK
jgi:hypothetical protein